MAKAAQSTTETLSVEQAASAIVAMINARAASPTLAEIAEVIAKALAPATSAKPVHSALAQQIRTLLPELQAAILAKTGADARAIGAGVDPDEFPEHIDASRHAEQLETDLAVLVDKLWSSPVRSFEDVVLIAEIAQHKALDWVTHGESDGLLDPACYDLEAYGRLTMAVLALAGKPFNAHACGAAEPH